MTTEDNSKGVISPEVSDVQACPVADEQTSRQDYAGQRYGINVTRQVGNG
jgi:hypothetical protein